ncbi:MAG: ribosome maturation factor RimP [Acidimicrobiales bacterium]
MTETERRITDIVTPLLDEVGLRCYDIEHRGSTLRVLVDRDGGADMDQITRATKAISRALDEEDPLAGRYTLEVSSPGLERPLRRPDHFVGAVGRRSPSSGSPGWRASVAQGTLDGRRRRRHHGGGGHRRRRAPLQVRYDEIEKARTVFDWEPTPRPGSAGRGKATTHKRVTTT